MGMDQKTPRPEGLPKPSVLPPGLGRQIGLAGLLTALLLAGCGGGHYRPVTEIGQPHEFSEEKKEAWLRADSLWEGRDDPRQARAALRAYVEADEAQPKVPALLTRISRAHHFVATYTEPDLEVADALYEEGARYARRALRLDPDFARVLDESGDEIEAAREVDGPFLEPLYWLASNAGRRLSREDDFTRRAHEHRLGTFVDILSRRADTLAQGGPDRFLGVYHLFTATPDIDSSAFHFDRALQRNPHYLGNRTLRAEYLDVARGDSAAFRRNLEAVIEAPETAPAETAGTAADMAPENRMEKARAKKLLTERENLFP